MRLPSPIVELYDERISQHGLRLLVKRDDLIHPDLPGNKWRKLKYNVQAAEEQGHKTLLTFGGAYSNHIRATAAVGHYFGFSTVGVIRGEEHLPLNDSLAYAVDMGMRLTYLDRTTYRRKTDPDVIASLRARCGEFYLLPEGGSNTLAVRGCAELPGEIRDPFDVICCACGTGGTLAGIAAGLQPRQRAIGISVLKGGSFLDRDVDRLQRETYGNRSDNWSVEYGFHFGGFARRTAVLEAFIADFAERHDIMLDWLYVGKMMYGIFAKAEQGSFAEGTRIVAVITGPAMP